MPSITTFVLALSVSLPALSFSQPAIPSNPAAVARVLADQYSNLRQFSFDGTLLFERKNGLDAREVLASWKVKVAMAPGGKYLLWAGNDGVLKYLVVSDGKTVWSYMPELNQYTRHEGGATEVGSDPDDIFAKGVPDGDHDVVFCSRLVVPALARLSRNSVFMEMNRTTTVNYKGSEQQFPVLSVLSQRGENDSQILIELAFEPESNDVHRFEWSRAMLVNEDSRFAFLTVEFEKRTLGKPIPESFFTLAPPGDAELVDELPIPGLDGSPLLGKQAPDFELELINGTKVHLADFKGRPVVLAFWTVNCASCRRELAALAALQQEFQSQGLAVLAINAEGKSVATRSAGAADFPPLAIYDPGGRVHRLFRAHFAPTVVVLNSEAKVVRYLSGARDAAALRAALKTAGLVNQPPSASKQ